MHRSARSPATPVVLGAILFIYALSFPRREVVRPGPVERKRLANNPDQIAAE